MDRNHSENVLRLVDGAKLEPQYRESMVDCRLLLLGDRRRQLLRAYPEVIYRLSKNGGASNTAEVLESEEIRQYYDVVVSADRIRLTLKDAVFREQYPLEVNDFELCVSAGRRAVAFPLPLDRFRALGALLPLLSGRHGETEILNRLDATLSDEERRWSRDLLANLESHGFVERGKTRPNSFLKSPARPRVTFVGHTTLLLQTKGASILVDPLLRPEFGTSAKAFDLTSLELSAICCTHAHWDHCDVTTLLRFDKNIPVIIPRVRKATAFNPPIKPMLTRLGFQDVREFDSWESVRLGDVEMILVPFHGEQDEPGAEIDHYTYVYRTDGLTLYGGVDSYLDSVSGMDGVLGRVRNEYHPSVAFLPISRMVYHYKWGGVNGFCRYIDSTLINEQFQYTAGPKEAAEWVRLLGVSTVVPYATFTFSPNAAERQFGEFTDELRERNLEATVLPLRPLDALELSDLNGSAQAIRRRLALCRWQKIANRTASLDRHLQGNPVYRYARRVLVGTSQTASCHHH